MSEANLDRIEKGLREGLQLAERARDESAHHVTQDRLFWEGYISAMVLALDVVALQRRDDNDPMIGSESKYPPG